MEPAIGRSKILAVSGSLRAHSRNSALLQALSLVAPPTMEFSFENGIATLPHFNPDLDQLDQGQAPALVAEFRQRWRDADALVICSPEYAHGLVGSLKNALDWLVGSGEIVGKTVVVLNASPLSIHGHAALIEVLTTMDARVVDWVLPAPRAGERSAQDFLANPEVVALLQRLLEGLQA